MSVTLHLVRHGEAAAAWGDDPDPGLSALGREQAEAAARVLAAAPIARALTSPLRRCRETADAFARLGGRVARVEPFVAEIPTPRDVVDRKVWLADLMAGAWPRPPHPHAALLSTFRLRLLWTLQAQTVETVIFTHFVAINAALGFALGEDRVLLRRPANAAIVSFSLRHGRLTLIDGGFEGASAVL